MTSMLILAENMDERTLEAFRHGVNLQSIEKIRNQEKIGRKATQKV